MKRGWLVATAAFFALFCFTIWESLDLPILDALGPGPGFFPLWLSLIGAVLSFLLAIETARIPVLGDGTSLRLLGGATGLTPARGALSRILPIIFALAGPAAANRPLGWRITATVVAAVLLIALGARSPLAIVPFAAAAGFGVFHIFYYWLKVPLPIGTFGI